MLQNAFVQRKNLFTDKAVLLPNFNHDNRMLPDRKAATIRNNARSLPFACTLIMLYKEARIL